ncbi:MAG: hypothetical protein K8R11_13150, partial [Methanococcoides sp.]|nr:hypothetical protein [Methanococcoides sp.]
MKAVLFQRVRSLLFFLSVFFVLFFSVENAWAYSPTIAGGGYHTIALKTDGTVWAWGHNRFGQIGDGTTTYRSSPVQVAGLADVAAIAGGLLHTIALKTDGTVWAWGDN